MGCFIDQIDNRDLDIFINENEQLTPAQCISTCQRLNYHYAGIQYGSECRCGQQYGKYGQVSEDECNYSCKTSEKCGGNNRNSVYDAVKSIDLSQTGKFCLSFFLDINISAYRSFIDSTCLNTVVGYQGCFDGVTLENLIGIVNSIEECVSYCVLNYNYAGIMNR